MLHYECITHSAFSLSPVTKIYCFFSVDFVLDQKNVSLLEAYDKWRNWADSKVCCDYALHSCVTWWSPEVAKEMDILCKEKGIYNIPYSGLFSLGVNFC